MTYRGRIGTVRVTGREAGVDSLEWEIPGFPSLATGWGDYYASPFFDACGGTWTFYIFPRGMTSFTSGDCDLLLWRVDSGAGETYSVAAGIRAVEGVRNGKKLVQEFSPRNRGCSWFQFFCRSQLSGLLNGNSLIVTLDVKIDEPRDASTRTLEAAKEAPTEEIQASGKKDASCQTLEAAREAPIEEIQSLENKDASAQTLEAAREAPIEEIQPSEKKGIEKLVEDIGKLLVSGENCDVTVKVGDAEFKAHRTILSARCPVLSAMLKHETAERASGKITVRDCEPDIFGDFLHYIYRGSVQRLSEKNVFDLYCVADQYLAEDLKQQCLEHIRDTLSVQTFCNTVRLALTHEQGDLLEQAVEFATTNIRSIIRTVEWQQFMRDCPTEANEILIKSLGPPS